MILESSRRRSARPRPVARIALTFVIPVVLLSLFLWGLRQPLELRLWDWAVRRGYDSEYAYTDRLRTEIPLAVRNWVFSIPRRSDVPRVALDIKFRHFARLRAQREAALAWGVLIQGEDDYVPGVLRFADRSVDVEVRLKGDVVDQLKDGKWSFRVHVKGDDHVFGMKRFNLHPPDARDFHTEPLLLDHMRQMGVLAGRYLFVEARLNGDRLGVMAIEEHFSTELLESQGRKESVILKLDESRYWSFSPVSAERHMSPFHSYVTAELQPFRLSRILKSPTLGRDLRVATGLYRAFLNGRLDASAVFDPVLMGRYLAVAQVWRATHATGWTNIRFYYNPISAKLEPVAYDAELRSNAGLVFQPGRLANRFIADSVIRRHYLEALREISKMFAPGGVGHVLESAQARYLVQLRPQFPFLTPVDLAELAATATTEAGLGNVDTLTVEGESVTGEFRSSMVRPSDLVLAHTITDGGRTYLEFNNLVPFEVEVVPSEAAANAHRLEDSRPASVGHYRLFAPLRLTSTAIGQLPRSVRVGPVDSGSVDSVFVRATGAAVGAWIRPSPYFPPLAAVPIPEPSLAAVSRHRFFHVDPVMRTISAEPGRWEVAASISLPEGFGLVLPAGTELSFDRDAVLITRGPTRFEGTRDDPVILRGRNDGRNATTWKGLVAFNAGSQATWSHVRLLNTSGVSLKDWQLTGGTTIYRGRVSMTDVRFIGNRAEDALNLVHTTFSLDHVAVVDAISDGLDIDFGAGSIDGSDFENVGWIGGGDAVDVSGGTVRIASTSFRRIGDKAISVGEGSTVHVDRVTIVDAGAGAVSKDGSYLMVDRSRFGDVHHAALMAYVKKRVYGGAVLEATHLDTSGVRRLAHSPIGSVLAVDGRVVRGERINVDSLYATVMRPGLRR